MYQIIAAITHLLYSHNGATRVSRRLERYCVMPENDRASMTRDAHLAAWQGFGSSTD